MVAIKFLLVALFWPKVAVILDTMSTNHSRLEIRPVRTPALSALITPRDGTIATGLITTAVGTPLEAAALLMATVMPTLVLLPTKPAVVVEVD